MFQGILLLIILWLPTCPLFLYKKSDHPNYSSAFQCQQSPTEAVSSQCNGWYCPSNSGKPFSALIFLKVPLWYLQNLTIPYWNTPSKHPTILRAMLLLPSLALQQCRCSCPAVVPWDAATHTLAAHSHTTLPTSTHLVAVQAELHAPGGMLGHLLPFKWCSRDSTAPSASQLQADHGCLNATCKADLCLPCSCGAHKALTSVWVSRK